jgi:hypothetical protein
MIERLDSEINSRQGPEREMREETGLAVRKARKLARISYNGESLKRAGQALLPNIMALFVTEKQPGHGIRSLSNNKSAMLHHISLRKALAQLIDSFIVMLPLIVAPVIIQRTGAEDFSSIYISAPMLSTAALSGSIALFLAWGISYFMVTERLWGMTPGKAITGERGIGRISQLYGAGRSLLGCIKNILWNLFHIQTPSLSIVPARVRPGRDHFFGKHPLIQRKQIPLPQTIIDITA